MTTQLPTGPAIRRHADGSIDFGFYRAEARSLHIEQCRAAWKWISGTVRNAISRARHGLSTIHEIDIVTRLR